VSNLVQRLLLFFLGVPAMLALIVFLPFAKHLAAVLMVLVFIGGGAVELASLYRRKGIPALSSIVAILGLAPPAAAYAGSVLSELGSRLPAYGFLCIALPIIAFAAFSPFALIRKKDFPDILPLAAAYGFTLVYPGLFGAFIVLIASEPAHASESLICFALMTFGNDSLAWLAGVTLGRRRGIVPVSPSKSLAGFIGGMAGSVLVALASPFVFPHAVSAPWPLTIVWGLAVGTAVIFGDLFESALKRSAGAKDSGSSIPGRGGFLDSFDSLLFAAPVYFGLSLVMGLFR
jgi:phosphatidate cytidylyltransferase